MFRAGPFNKKIYEAINYDFCTFFFLLIVSFSFIRTSQITDFGLYIPKDIFFKITECIVPNLLTPTHPKEILYQDTELNSYRLVCKKWRDLLDQRVDFAMFQNYFPFQGWDAYKLVDIYKKRLFFLKDLYFEKNKWIIDQDQEIKDYSELLEPSIKRKRLDYRYQCPVINSADCCMYQYQKIMKLNMLYCDTTGLLMLKKYLSCNGFLNYKSLMRKIIFFFKRYRSCIEISEDLFKGYDLTYIFARLFKKFALANDNYCIIQFKSRHRVNYRLFLDFMYKSFFKKVDLYFDCINFCSKARTHSLSWFFNFFMKSFINKDYSNKYFLYYLLLYSHDKFFKIQMILLLDFIKGSEKKFADYPEPDRIECINLFRKNIMGRMQKIFCETEDFLKAYFGID